MVSRSLINFTKSFGHLKQSILSRVSALSTAPSFRDACFEVVGTCVQDAFRLCLQKATSWYTEHNMPLQAKCRIPLLQRFVFRRWGRRNWMFGIHPRFLQGSPSALHFARRLHRQSTICDTQLSVFRLIHPPLWCRHRYCWPQPSHWQAYGGLNLSLNALNKGAFVMCQLCNCRNHFYIAMQ